MAKNRSQSMGLLTKSSQPRPQALFPVFAHGICGHGDDRGGETAGAELSDGLVAVEDRHLHVHDHGIEGASLEGGLGGPIQGLLAVQGRDDLGAGLDQSEADQLLIGLVVVGHQDSSMEPRTQGAVDGRDGAVASAAIARFRSFD